MKYIILVFMALLALVVGVYRIDYQNPTTDVFSSVALRTVVLDAGHGGEDGGAVAPDNTNEKDINLSVTLKIAAYFELFGIPYQTVRTEDISVCDDGLETLRQRKVSDIKNREKLVNSIPNAVFLSIHQNQYVTSDCQGTQIFYSANTPDSEMLAENIKTAVITALQPENKRLTKSSTSSIYLLYRAKTTAVMCECGFLSNPDDLQKLKNENYQRQIAYFIYRGTLDFLSNTKDT